MRPELFPVVPEDLSAVSSDDLQGLLATFTETAAELIADMRRPAEERAIDIGNMSATDLMGVLRSAATDRKRIEDHLAGLAVAEQNFMDDLATVAGELGVASAEALAAETEPEPEPAEPSEPAEPEPVAEPVAAEPALAAAEVEPVAASPEPTTEPEPARSLAIPRGPSRMEPKVTAGADTPVLVATAGLGSIKVRENTPLGRRDFAEAVANLAQSLGQVKHVRGGTEDKFPVARLDFNFPDAFTLGGGGMAEMDKIRAVAWNFLGLPDGASEEDVFQAAGGICAPPTPFYDVPSFASRERPVRAALPSFQAARGGVSLPSVATIDRADSGVTVIEESADAQGGTFSAKSCRTITCATWTDTFVGIISHCLEVGTLNARTWPEGIALEEDNQMAAHAGIAEARLLNRIKALSIQPSSYGQPYNGVHGFIYAIARAKAGIRNRLRAASGATYTALIPEWVQEFLIADLAAQSHTDDRYVSEGQVARFFSNLGVMPVWYKDSPTTGATQNFAAEAGGTPLDDFPDNVQWGLYLNGTFLHLDGGSLELGLVRDSTLNAQNDHQLFGETFENVARVGPEQSALWLTNAICPTGTFPALATALSC